MPSGQAANTLSLEERAAGWTLLFDGRTTSGWRGFQRQTFHAAAWAVEDGTLVVQFETDSAESAAGIAAGTFKDVAGCADKIPTPILLQDHNIAAWFRSLKIRPVPAR